MLGSSSRRESCPTCLLRMAVGAKEPTLVHCVRGLLGVGPAATFLAEVILCMWIRWVMSGLLVPHMTLSWSVSPSV